MIFVHFHIFKIISGLFVCGYNVNSCSEGKKSIKKIAKAFTLSQAVAKTVPSKLSARNSVFPIKYFCLPYGSFSCFSLSLSLSLGPSQNCVIK